MVYSLPLHVGSKERVWETVKGIKAKCIHGNDTIKPIMNFGLATGMC